MCERTDKKLINLLSSLLCANFSAIIFNFMQNKLFAYKTAAQIVEAITKTCSQQNEIINRFEFADQNFSHLACYVYFSV